MDTTIQPGHEEKIGIDLLPVGVILTDEVGIVRHINRQAEMRLGDRCPVGSAISALLDRHPTRIVIQGEVHGITVAPFEGAGYRGQIYILQSLEDVLREEAENKIRESGEMVAEIAHEIRNPLGSIELLASLLRKTMKDEKDIKRINQIILSVETINERISELLRLSKERALRKRSFSLRHLIQDILRVPGQTDSFLLIRLTEEELPVCGDEKMLRQMFLNLLIQVLQTMPPETRLHVEMAGHLREGRAYAEVAFRCEGERSIFQNFDLALGLNLAIIHNINHMHNGIVNIGRHAIAILLPMTEP